MRRLFPNCTFIAILFAGLAVGQSASNSNPAAASGLSEHQSGG